jgi:hypothetical protein
MSLNNAIIELQSIRTSLQTQITSVVDNYKSIKNEKGVYIALIDIIDTRFGYINDLMIRINNSIDSLISYNNLDEGFYVTKRVFKCFSAEECNKIAAIKDNNICTGFAVDSDPILKQFIPKFLDGSYSTIGCFNNKGRFSCKVPLYNQIIKHYNSVIKYSKQITGYLQDINAFIAARSQAVATFKKIETDKKNFTNKLAIIRSEMPPISPEDLMTNHVSPHLLDTIAESINNNLDSEISCYAAATAFATNSCFQDFLNSCGTITRVMSNQIEYLLAVVRLLIRFDKCNIRINELNKLSSDWLNWIPLIRGDPLSDKTFNYHLYTRDGANGCYAWRDVDAKVSRDCHNKFCKIGSGLRCNDINLQDHVMIGKTSSDPQTVNLRPTTVDGRNIGKWDNNPGQMNCNAGWGKAVCALRNRRVYDGYQTAIRSLQEEKMSIAQIIFNLRVDETQPAPVKCCNQSVFCPGGQCNVVQNCNLTVNGITDVTTKVTHIDEVFTYNLESQASEVSGQRDQNDNVKQLCWSKDNANIDGQCMGGFVLKTDSNCYAPPNINQDCSPYNWDDFSKASNEDINFYARACKLPNPDNCPSYSSILHKPYEDPDGGPVNENVGIDPPGQGDPSLIIKIDPSILNPKMPKIPESKKPIISIPSEQQINEDKNIPIIQSISSVQNVPNIQPVSSVQNVPNIQSVSSVHNLPSVQTTPSTHSVPATNYVPPTFWDEYKIIIIIVIVLIICSCCAFLLKN